MPYKNEWVQADVALVHNGVTVYHAYKEENYEEPYEYWFLSSADGLMDESWDVRDLPSSFPEMTVEEMLKAGIEAGHIRPEEENP